jgi:hypothetical protein
MWRARMLLTCHTTRISAGQDCASAGIRVAPLLIDDGRSKEFSDPLKRPVGPYEIAGILNALLIAANFMVTSLRTRLLF